MNTTSTAGIAGIIRNEGSKLIAYPDNNMPPVWTIGIGCILMPDGQHVKEGDTITAEQEMQMLKSNLKSREDKLNLLCPKLSQPQFDAIMDFAYQEGAWQSSTLVRLACINPDDMQIKNEFKKWVLVSGRPSEGVIIRRARNIIMYFDGAIHKNDLIAEWPELKQALIHTNQEL